VIASEFVKPRWFDAPTRALGCPFGLVEKVADLGIDIRAAIHTGEIELRGGRRWRDRGSHRGARSRQTRQSAGHRHAHRAGPLYGYRSDFQASRPCRSSRHPGHVGGFQASAG
jgi:hypothetical protein